MHYTPICVWQENSKIMESVKLKSAVYTMAANVKNCWRADVGTLQHNARACS